MATLLRDGSTVNYTPGTAVDAGDIVVQGQLFGVACADIAASALGALTVAGVFSLPKATTSTSALTAGADVYWDSSGEVVTTTTSTNVYVGKVEIAAAATASTVNVLLDQ